jgi:hypothetical protein
MKTNIIFSKLTNLILFSFITIILFPIILISETKYEKELKSKIESKFNELENFDTSLNIDATVKENRFENEINAIDVKEKQNFDTLIKEYNHLVIEKKAEDIKESLKTQINSKTNEKIKGMSSL